ncbi:hypothetical protein SAMN04488008_1044 [Maribacter orientalis]|uniref:Uncharacterized protein n=1 Tax=Maribacter orientalis TaxID=228957 RepID=A0A1H7QKB6_9FLAO|nr:hypothetical protein SAMN04488008_1044 [Maribacter orientalis]
MNNELKLLGAVLLLLISLVLGIRELRIRTSLGKNDYSRKSMNIKKCGGIIGLILVSVFLIYEYFNQ